MNINVYAGNTNGDFKNYHIEPTRFKVVENTENRFIIIGSEVNKIVEEIFTILNLSNFGGLASLCKLDTENYWVAGYRNSD